MMTNYLGRSSRRFYFNSILLILFLLSNNIISNDRAKSNQSISTETNSYLNHSLKGNSLVIKMALLFYWDKVQLFKDGKEFFSKDILDEGHSAILFDSLDNGEYKLKFTSYFNDTFQKDLTLSGDLKLNIIPTLEKYYTELNFQEIPLEEIMLSDTIQMLFQHIGCFSYDRQLIEFITTSNNSKARIKSLSNWEELNLTSPKQILRQMIIEGKNFNGIEDCTMYDYYSFKKKGSKNVYTITDASCNWFVISKIIKK